MLKTAFSALLILLLSAAGASADPISGAIAVIGSLLSSTGLVKLALVAAINFGMSLIEQAKARRAARKNQRPSGVSLSIQMGDTQPRSYLIGTRATAGRRIYFGTWGQAGKTPNAYATDVIELSCLPNHAGPQGLDAVWIGDKKVTVLWDQPHPDGRGYPIEGYQQGGGDWLWIKFLDGSQTVADPFLVATFGGHADRPFKSTMIGRGCQVVILTARFNQEFFKSGLPQGLYQPKPMRLYDLRKDSSNGGVGDHRWSDPSTWEASDSLGVMIYNVARGIYYDGRWVHGGRNFAQHRLPASSWIAALNEADRLIGGRKQFRGGLEVFVDQDPLDVIEDLRLGCAGRLAEVGGILKLLIGAPAAAVYSFTDQQITVTSEQDFEPFPTVSATHNTITAVYPEPEQKWTDKDAPERSSATLLERDGGERLPIQVRFEAVSILAQVRRLMATMIDEEQRWRVHELVLPPDAAPLEPNDVVAWSSDRNFYSNKKFLIERAISLPGLLQRLVLRELDPSDYDPPDIDVPVVVGPTGPVDPPLQPVFGFNAVPASILDSSGNSRRPAIKVTTAADQDDVDRLWVQVELKSNGTQIYNNAALPYDAPYEWMLNAQFLPQTLYRVRGKFIPKSKRVTRLMAWSDWIDVMTPNILIGTVDVLDNAITAGKIADGAITAAKIMDGAISNLKLLDGSLTITKFANGIEPVGIIEGSELPTTKTTETIYFQNKLYTWNSTSNQYETPQVGIGEVADGSITAQKLADAAVTAAKLAALAVTHEAIAAGAIFGDKIAANSITARELVLTDFSNIYPDYDFISQSLYSPGGGATFSFGGTSMPTSGKNALYLDPIAANGGVFSPYFPVEALTEYWVEAVCGVTATAVGAGTARVYIYLYSVDATGTPVLSRSALVVGSKTDSASSTRVGASILTSSSERMARLYFRRDAGGTHSAFFGGPMVRRKNNANLIVDGAITANHLSVDSVTANAISAGAITAGKIAAGAVSATEIAAGAITAAKMVISDFYNLASNPAFREGLTDWSLFTGYSVATTGGYQGGPYLNFPATAPTGFTHNANRFPVKPGDKIQLTAIARAAGATAAMSGSLRFRIICVDAAETWLAPVQTNVTFSVTNGVGDTTTAFVERSGEYTIPDGAVYAWVAIQNLVANSGFTWRVSRVEARRKSTGQLIVDGSITGDNIAANTIGALQIAANAITAKNLLLTDFTNLIQNWDFSDITNDTMEAIWDFSHPYMGNGSLATPCFRVVTTGSLTGWYQLTMDQVTPASASMYMTTKNLIPVTSGEILAAEAVVRTSGTAATAGLYFRFYWYDASGVPFAANTFDDVPGMSNGPVPSAYGTPKRGKVTVPAGVAFCRIRIYHHNTDTIARHFMFDHLAVRRANAAELIVDGSITADMLTVNSLTAISANLGNASVTGVISSTNGKMVLDFNNGYISISD